jgi:hypothetical protein
MSINYIPSPSHFKNYFTYQKYPDIFKPTNKVPVSKIKIDKKQLSYANEISKNCVVEIINNFHIEGWEPIFISPDYYLIDGQHRLAAARKMKLKFIDVVIIDNHKLEN